MSELLDYLKTWLWTDWLFWGSVVVLVLVIAWPGKPTDAGDGESEPD